MRGRFLRLSLAGIPLLLLAVPPVHADYRADIGYTLLQSELGADMPNGSGIAVSHVEAATIIGDDPAWMPNPDNPQFSGKTIRDMSFAAPGQLEGWRNYLTRHTVKTRTTKKNKTPRSAAK